MVRGRPRKSLEHHIATGAIYKNPKRFKARIELARAEAEEIQPPSAFLRETPESTKLLEIWNDLVSSADGLAMEEDKFLLEQLACLIHESRRGGTKPSHRRAVMDMERVWNDRLRRRREANGGSSQPEAETFGEFA